MSSQTSELAQTLACPAAPACGLPLQRAILRAWLVATDALALWLAFECAFWIRFVAGITLAPEAVPNPSLYPNIIRLFIPLFILIFYFLRLYETQLLLGGAVEYAKMFHACTTAVMIVILATFFQPEFVISRLWLSSSWILSFLFCAAGRFFTRRIGYTLRRNGYLLSRAVIVGDNDEAAVLSHQLGDWRSSGFRILGVVSTNQECQLKLPVLGGISELPQIIQAHEIEDVIVAITALDREQLLRVCEDVNVADGVALRLTSGLYELLATGVTVRTFNSVPLVSLNKVRLERHESYFKSLLEYAFTAVGLAILWPVFVLIAIAVKLDSQGPVFHRRRVLGVSGRPFDALKFRTMCVDQDVLLRDERLFEEYSKQRKLKSDPRVTRVGRLLRRYSLDELPQLFNVLMGQMSLVGPRIISPAEAEKYGRHKLNLLTVTPGMTGLWQVSGRSDLSYEERVRLDMYYIRNYSVWLDLQILFVQTLPAVLRGRGAY